jgi:excinuclease UvrABC nuclease subunit
MAVITSLRQRTWYDFTSSNLESVPNSPGVYWLGKSNQIIYIGSSVDLNDRLHDHYYSDDAYIRKATQFAIEECSNYRERERQLLLAFHQQHGRLPECNDRLP